MKKVITLVVLLAFASTIILQDVMAAGPRVNEPASAGAKYSIAVLELESIGRISTSDAGRLTEILRSEFGGAGIFEVMSKSQLETALQGAGLSMMGCSTIDCALLAGRAAATKLVTFGSISKTSSTYDLEVQLVHVKSGQVVQSVRESFDGDFGALEAHMTTVAQKLMGTPRGPNPTAGSMAGQESSRQTAAESSWETPASEASSGDNKDYRDNEGSGNKALILGLAAVGLVGGGILISQAIKDDGTNNNNNPPPPGGTLPNPPTFP
jgi:hypothetical protein